MSKAKPFVKWAGGKSQLIQQLEALLPTNFDEKEEITYIEPFVGGGAMLFHMLQTHKNIKRAVINDINPDLTACYEVVKHNPQLLISELSEIQGEYLSIKSEDARKDFYLTCRNKFNAKISDKIENSCLFIFLNHTCFNGLYRVNKSGKFNVPFGRYVSPKICDAETIVADSNILQNVEIMTGDFTHTYDKIDKQSFFYFDPPYRPLSSTSSFNDYSKENFNDEAQIRLKQFCDKLHRTGIQFLLSNSDCLGYDGKDRFFDDLFENYNIYRVWASRCVNANGSKRGKLTEIVVGNFANRYMAV